jgi:hypothetical protein
LAPFDHSASSSAARLEFATDCFWAAASAFYLTNMLVTSKTIKSIIMNSCVLLKSNSSSLRGTENVRGGGEDARILTLALPAAFLEFSPAGFFGMFNKYTDIVDRT